MLIAIASDSHDQWEHLERVISIANTRGCELLFFAGDLIAPPGLSILERFEGKVKFVWGNNEAERVGMVRLMDASEKVELCGDLYEDVLNGVRVFMCHRPRYAQLAAKSGEFDLCIYGHTHEYSRETVGSCELLNPGEVSGYATQKPGFVIFNTETRSVEHVSLI